MAAEIVKVMRRDNQVVSEELEEYAIEGSAFSSFFWRRPLADGIESAGLFAPMESSSAFGGAAATSTETAPPAWGAAASSTSTETVPPAWGTAAGWGAAAPKSDESSGGASSAAPKPWGQPAATEAKTEPGAEGYDSGYGASSPETSPAKSTAWGRSSSPSPPANEDISPVEVKKDFEEAHALETIDDEERPEDFLAKMSASRGADSDDGGSGTITPTEAARLEADLNKVSLDDDPEETVA